MKMTKTVLAVAIAGVAAAPMAASATTNLSGAIQLQVVGSDNEDPFENSNGEGGFEDGEARIATGDVIIGINAEQALNIGLTGYGSLRIDLDDFSGSSDITTDNVFAGIKGGFGDFRIGEVSNPAEFGQLSDNLTDIGEGINEGISLTGSFLGATVGVGWSPTTNQDIISVGARFGFRGFSIGAGVQDFDELMNASASVGFAFAGASIGLGFQSIEDGFAAGEDETAITATVGYSIAGVSLGLAFTGEQESGDSDVQFDAGYDLGGGLNVSFRFSSLTLGDDTLTSEVVDDDGVGTGVFEADRSEVADWRIQLSKSF